MSVLGQTAAVRTVVSDFISGGPLKCRKYDTWDVRAGNIATLGLAKYGMANTMDQRYGFHTLTLPVLIYQVIGNSIDVSLAYHETNFENVIQYLGSDRTLGNAVVTSEVGDDANTSYYRVDGGASYAVTSFDLVVTPRPNVGG